MPGGLEKLHGLLHFLAWCLSSPLLIPLSLSPSLLLCLFLSMTHTPFFCLAPSVYPQSFTPWCPLSLLFASINLSVSQLLLYPSLLQSPMTQPFFYFSHHLLSSQATATPPHPTLFFLLSVSILPSRWHYPCGSRWISMTGLGPFGSRWLASEISAPPLPSTPP